jgi:hypothetical protein
MVPFGADQTLFVIIDRTAGNKEVRVERPDFESALRDLIAGCFNDPVRVIAFNTLEHWVRDVSADAAAEIQARCDIEGDRLPDHIRDFVEIHVCTAARATGAAAPLPADAI